MVWVIITVTSAPLSKRQRKSARTYNGEKPGNTSEKHTRV